MDKIPVDLGPGWDKLSAYLLSNPDMQKLAVRILKVMKEGRKISPEPENIFRAFKLTPPDKIKVVIIGQDPYPTDADGLAFSNKNMRPSLRVIFKALELEGFGKRVNTDLTDWAEQGVFLLNTSLTTELGKTAAHVDWGWDQFINVTIEFINRIPRPIVVMLWGKHAQKLEPVFVRSVYSRLILESCHPQAMNYSPGHNFYRVQQFLHANEWLTQQYEHANASIKWVDNGEATTVQTGKTDTSVRHVFTGPVQSRTGSFKDQDTGSASIAELRASDGL